MPSTKNQHDFVAREWTWQWCKLHNTSNSPVIRCAGGIHYSSVLWSVSSCRRNKAKLSITSRVVFSHRLQLLTSLCMSPLLRRASITKTSVHCQSAFYIQLYPSFNDSRKKEEKKQTNKQPYKCSQFKSFSSRLAKPETAPFSLTDPQTDQVFPTVSTCR